MRNRADFLDLQSRLDRRVTSLENGSHPLRSALDFAASYPLTTLPEDGIFTPNFTFGSYFGRFKKRLGHVQFIGSVRGNLKDLDSDGEQISHLPEGLWPVSTMRFHVVIERSPWFTTIDIDAAGLVILYNTPGFTTGTNDIVHLDQVNFIAEANL